MTVRGFRGRLQKDMALPAPPRHEERSAPALDSTLADLGLPTRIGRLGGEGTVLGVTLAPLLAAALFSRRFVAPATLAGLLVVVGIATNATNGESFLLMIAASKTTMVVNPSSASIAYHSSIDSPLAAYFFT